MRRMFVIIGLSLLMMTLRAQSNQISDVNRRQEVENLAVKIVNYVNKGSNGIAVKRMNDLLGIYREQYTEQSTKYADCLIWCAMMCAEAGDARQANHLLKSSCSIFERYGDGPFKGRDTVSEILCRDALSKIEYHSGREYYAITNARKSCDLKREFFGDKHPAYLKSVLDLSSRYAERLRGGKSREYHNLGFFSYVELIKTNFCEQSESERTVYWNTAIKYIEKTLDVAYKNRSQTGREKSIPSATFDALLLSKGLLLNTTKGFENYIIESGNEKAISVFLWKKQMAAQNASQNILDSLDYVILKELKMAGMTYNIPHLSIRWQDVQNRIGDDDIAIEFFKTTENEYGAVLLKKKWKTPKIVALGRYVKQEKSLQTLHHVLQALRYDEYTLEEAEYLWSVSKAVWTDEIIKYFPTTMEGRVFFSADGELLMTGVEYLPFIKPYLDKNGTIVYHCISDIYKLYRLSSTRELVLPYSELSNNEVDIYGGLKYSMSANEMLTDANYYKSSHADALAYHSVSKNRGARSALSGLDELKGTKIEADSLVSTILQLKLDSWKINLYTSDKGTEASFKALSGRRPRIIHVATHGFFYDEQDVTCKTLALDDNPLMRSGLFMAGADNKMLGEDIPEEVDDGILTALEVANVDFRGVDMVVLSACETAKGNISSDGVFGLQRGFKMAGVNSIVMSLWKVDDDATCMLMTGFYKNWMSGMSKIDALNAAKNTVRSHTEKGWDHPKYWAAFILLDGLD